MGVVQGAIWLEQAIFGALRAAEIGPMGTKWVQSSLSKLSTKPTRRLRSNRIEELTGRVDGDAGRLHVLILRPDRERAGERECDGRPILGVAPGHPPLGLIPPRLVFRGRLPVDRHDAERRKKQRSV